MSFNWIDITIANLRDYASGRSNVYYLVVADSWCRNAEQHGAPRELAAMMRAVVNKLKPRATEDCYKEMQRCVRESTARAEHGDLEGARASRLWAIDYTDGFLRFFERSTPFAHEKSSY